MKVPVSHRETIRKAIEPFDTEHNRARYRAGDFPRADKVNDLNKRYRWDLLWAACRTPAMPLLSNLYESGDYNDSHLDTALKAIVPPL